MPLVLFFMDCPSSMRVGHERSFAAPSSQRARAENAIPHVTRRLDVDEEVDFDDDTSVDTLRYGDSIGNLDDPHIPPS